VQVQVEQLRVTLQAIERFDAEIAAVSETLPDYALFRALPGAGPTFAPRLLAAFGEQRERYHSAAGLQRYSGIAPVTESSGKQHWFTGGCNARRSYDRPSLNGRAPPFRIPSGPPPIIDSSATKDARITRRCAHWLSNGFAFSTVAGRPGRPTMSRPISTHSSTAAHHCSLR